MNINPQIFTARYRKAMRENVNDNHVYLHGVSSAMYENDFPEIDRLAQCYALVEALFESIDQLPGHEVTHVLNRIIERMGRDE